MRCYFVQSFPEGSFIPVLSYLRHWISFRKSFFRPVFHERARIDSKLPKNLILNFSSSEDLFNKPKNNISAKLYFFEKKLEHSNKLGILSQSSRKSATNPLQFRLNLQVGYYSSLGCIWVWGSICLRIFGTLTKFDETLHQSGKTWVKIHGK